MAKIIVNDENGNMIAEFPEGTSDAVIKEVLARDFQKINLKHRQQIGCRI